MNENDVPQSDIEQNPNRSLVNRMSEPQVILLLTHYLNPSILAEFQSLKNSCSGKFLVKLLYDNTRRDFDRSAFEDESEFFLFDIDMLAANFNLLYPKARTIVPGNCIFPVLLFSKLNDHFRYLWMVEYDARFSGDWGTFFDSFETNGSDLLGTTLYRYNFRPEWNWWRSLKTPVVLPKKDWIRGYFPVLRLSKVACDILTVSYNTGWSGHYEVCIPTVLNLHGYAIEDIGGDGEFVKPGNTNRFYINTPSAAGLAPGTFVCPPHSCAYTDTPNKLFHPVKTEKEVT